jgi:UDP-glucose 4-epimerase
MRYAGSLGVDIPPETVRLLKYGRGVDNSLFKKAGFRYSYTSAGAVDAYAKGQRLRSTIGATQPVYRYERDVEAFFRHSPAIVRTHQRS